MRVAVVLLVAIAVASTVGILLPQPESFNLNSYVNRRLDLHSPDALRPKDFVALARAAGILADDKEFSSLAAQAELGTLSDDAWQSFLARFVRDAQRDEAGHVCLRLAYVDSFGKTLGRALLVLRFHVVFTSAWFRLLCVLLIVNLVLCSADHLPAQWRAAFGLRPGGDRAWYLRRATHAAMVLEGEGEAAAAAVESSLRVHGFRVERRLAGDAVAIEATRGWLGGLGALWRPLGRLAGLGRLGAQVVHLGVILVVIGGFVSGRLSLRHGQLLARDEVVAVPNLSKLAAARAQDWRQGPGEPAGDALFRLKLRRFEVRMDPRGKPEYYGSHVTLLDTEPPTDFVIEVNRPLVYRGFHVYQQSYQPDYRGITSVSFLVAKVRAQGGAAEHAHGGAQPVEVLQQASVELRPGETVAVPGMDLKLRVVRYFPHWQIPLSQTPDGRIVAGEAQNLSDEPRNPAVQVRLEAPGAEARERWVPLPFRAGEPRPGGAIDFAGYRIVPLEFAPDYATYLTFKTHPVMLPVWIGCGVMMLGVVLCFYCGHERVWALVRPLGDGRCEVVLAGDAFKWRERFRERFQAITAALRPGSGRATSSSE